MEEEKMRESSEQPEDSQNDTDGTPSAQQENRRGDFCHDDRAVAAPPPPGKRSYLLRKL